MSFCDRMGLRSVIPQYEILELLKHSGDFSFYRALQKSDGARVLIKIPSREQPSVEDRECLRREWQLLKSLTIPGVPRTHAISEDDCALILEDSGGTPLDSFSAPADLGLTLDLGVQLCATLAELHRSGVTHNVIHPGGILFDAERKRAQLIDFSGAGQDTAPRALRANFTYCSPEQTGRMNRTCDYRTDFYSLGAVQYWLLTGKPPFQSADPLELVHSHIARTPVAPIEVDPAIPKPLSDIVMKLLAKTAEERYQSALGLQEDLERCAREWVAGKRVAPFVLGSRDVSDRFLVSQKLYGREKEVAALLEAFDRVCQRAGAALMLVAGYSGIGKTSLIRELYRPIARERGYFVAGKFDQLSRDIPYQALIQAFQQLVRQLLSESAQRLALARERLSGELANNADVIAEVIPEIELILGPQPPSACVTPAEAQNRFNRAMQSFVAAIASPSHPLVVFLDDLQWVDSATLNLLEPLLTSPDVRGLFLIGAYRDNEVGAEHPLMRAKAKLEQSDASIETLALSPLGFSDLAQMTADTLKASDTRALAEILLDKTGGNPFFMIQFMKALHQDGLIVFDVEQAQWTCRIDAIRNAAMTDNVIDLMTHKINRLGVAAQRVITLAACIGNRFDLDSLATVSEQSAQTAREQLSEAIAAGLVLPQREGTFAFLHDRVQQAAYAKIAATQKPHTHLTIGRLLLRQHGETEEKVFDIASHLNIGCALMTGEKERTSLARLNLAAGEKAKKSTAYSTALAYFTAGARLLGEEHWHSDYPLAFKLNLYAAECEYLCGQFDQAEARFECLLGRGKTKLDLAEVYKLKILQYESASRYLDAIKVGHAALKLFGLDFAEDEMHGALGAELAQIQTLLGKRPIASLIDLPVMRDKETRMVMRLLAYLHTSCYLSANKYLTLLNTSAMVRLSLTHGNVEESAYGYVLHAMHLGPIRGDYAAAYEFGMLAINLSDRFNDPGLRARVRMNFAWNVSLWRRPIQESLPISRETFRLASSSGLLVETAYTLFNDCYFTLLAARELDTLQKNCAPHLEYVKRIKMRHFAEGSVRVILQWGRALQGLTETPASLTGNGFDEQAFRRDYRGENLFEMFYFVAKLALSYTFDQYHEARAMALEAERVIADYTGTIWDELTTFYHALTLAALYPELPPNERASATRRLDAFVPRLKTWAENAPRNYRHHYLLVCAEIAALRGGDAIALYEEAVAAPAECPRETALSQELFGKFWLRRGNHRIAALYLRDALDGYAAWGAHAKVQALVTRYGGIIGGRMREERGTLDSATIVKAAHAITGKIDLEDFLKAMLKIAMENAGAQKGLLIEEREGELYIAAQSELDPEIVIVPEGMLLTSLIASTSVVSYVMRTRGTLVIADASRDERFAGDAYIAARQPKSILCLPILLKQKLSAILYLENNLSAGSFTDDRIEVMQVLSTQSAISLENARLFDGLKEEIVQRQFAEQRLRQNADELRFLNDLVEQSDQPFAACDREGRFVRFNRAFEKLTGYTGAELLCLSYQDLTPERWRDSEAREIARMLGHKTPVRFEKEYLRKDGSLVPIELAADAYRGDSGELIALYAFVTDISERKRGEEMLRSITEGTAAVTGGDFFYSLVRALASALEVPYAFVTECRDETRARSLAFWKRGDFGDNFEYNVAGTPCQQVVQGTVCYYSENLQQLFPEDKDLIALETQSYLGVPLADAAGVTIGHLAVFDVKRMPESPRRLSVLKIFAARAAAEIERLRAQERERALLELNNSIITSLKLSELLTAARDALQRVIAHDRAAIAIYEPEVDDLRVYALDGSFAPDQLVVGKLLDVKGERGATRFDFRRPLLRNDLEEERQYFFDEGLIAAGMRSHCALPLVAGDKTIGILGISSRLKNHFSQSDFEFLQEVASQIALAVANVQAYEQIAALKARLQDENVYLRSELIANVSHDLRTPLASLRGYLETLLMKEDTLPSAKRRSYLEIATKQSAHLTSLVEELFELAKLDFKGFQLDPEPVKLDELARDIFQKFALAAEKNDITLKMSAGPHVPYVQANIGLIERALENLIANALKYARSRVRLKVLTAEGQVRIEVGDDGSGIAKEDLPLIFERFYRGEKSRKTPGAGLGLAITKRIVELHGGEIAVRSRPGEGTSFYFTLPSPR
ncbi:MAG: AAA family ATPase [Burkholderiales bacterium]